MRKIDGHQVKLIFAKAVWVRLSIIYDASYNDVLRKMAYVGLLMLHDKITLKEYAALDIDLGNVEIDEKVKAGFLIRTPQHYTSC